MQKWADRQLVLRTLQMLCGAFGRGLCFQSVSNALQGWELRVLLQRAQPHLPPHLPLRLRRHPQSQQCRSRRCGDLEEVRHAKVMKLLVRAQGGKRTE